MPDVDSIYYAHGMRVPLSKQVAIYARKRMLAHFTSTMKPVETTTILDFGASEDETEEANILEKHYEWPHRITCAGIGDGSRIKLAHPLVQYRSIRPHAALPFSDKEFDIAYSNAVFEHLGSDAGRAFAFAELLRVAKRVYITVPHGLFPIEHHTGIPLLHWVPPLFRRFVRGTALDFWASPENMDFMSKRRMRKVSALPLRMEYCGIALGPFSSNIAVWSDPR